MRDSVVEIRTDVEQVPEWLAIFSVVEQKLYGLIIGVDRSP